ncbi:MAG TPA: CBS domain-containing protein [Candidatus Dormibacteraeota bacterium]|nr:CBS domain-containing protein [Candidatus Dormibacteraeota bacterium]
MKVASVFRPGSPFVAPNDSLREAAIKMRASGQSCLPVLNGRAFTGIITERDLTEAVARGVRPAESSVVDYTNDGGVSVSLDDDVAMAEVKMLAIGCRNLPVLDRGSVVGTISMRDVVLKTAVSAVRPTPVNATAVPSEWPEEAAPDADSES